MMGDYCERCGEEYQDCKCDHGEPRSISEVYREMHKGTIPDNNHAAISTMAELRQENELLKAEVERLREIEKRVNILLSKDDWHSERALLEWILDGKGAWP